MTDPTSIFQRVDTSYDLKCMQRVRLICAGCGGSRSFLEDKARAGIGEFVLIDPETVEEANIGTQQVYLTDIGRPKVDCIADRLRQINPDVQVAAYQKSLDEITDSEFAFIMSDLPFLTAAKHGGAYNAQPIYALLCGMTDDFYAQARVNRLSLQFGLPSLSCQLYQFGQAGEITFTYPGVTPACQRCILSPRYRDYLERGYRNTVTSDGAPIFATTRINALCGMMALAILHHGTGHPRWGNVLERIGNRTLVQLRLHPDAPFQVFSSVFAGADTTRLFFDEAVWLPQEADPTCPDCGGTGDLRLARGTFSDTRLWERRPGQGLSE